MTQINIDSQNSQQAKQNPAGQFQPITKKTKINYPAICVIVLVCLVIFGLGGLYFSKQFSQYKIGGEEKQPIPSQPITGTVDTDSWKTYKNENITFKYPQGWIEKPILTIENGFTQEFQDPENEYSLSFSRITNFNQATGKPYENIDDFINMSYKVKSVAIAGQDARQPLPRAGSEHINAVMLFSKDSKLIYTLELKTGNTPEIPEADIKAGQKLFDQILSTVMFISEKSIITPTVSVQNYPRPPSWKTVVVKGKNISLCLPPKWEALDEFGNIIFNRDPAYKPQVTQIITYDYHGGLIPDDFINQRIQYENEPETLKKQTEVKNININGKSILKISIPTFPENLVFVLNNKLYSFELSSWNLVNDSKTQYDKDIYTMIGCVQLIY